MEKSTWRTWSESVGQSFLSTVLVALIPGVTVAWLEHIKSVWAAPALYGLGAMVLASVILLAIRATVTLPPKRLVPTTKNIEHCVRFWLDNYRVGVRNDPTSDAHFRLRLTLDSGSYLTVIRSTNDYPDYIQIFSFLGMHGDDKKLLEQFTDAERTQIFLDLKLELARAKLGYSGLLDPPENFHLFRRVPIHHTLTEYAFMSTVHEVEAAMNLVGIVFLKARARHLSEQKELT
jgi:hypothetical protein